jgi:hypothetical protein
MITASCLASRAQTRTGIVIAAMNMPQPRMYRATVMGYKNDLVCFVLPVQPEFISTIHSSLD